MDNTKHNTKREKKPALKLLVSMIALCLVTALVLCSCGSKTALTKETFISNATSYGLETEDAGQSASEIISGTLAYKSDGSSILWQAEFYALDSQEHAVAMFENNKTKFENGSGTTASISGGNYSTYEKTGDGKFKYLCRVDSTLLYIDINETYKDDAKAFIKQLGY